MGRVLAASIVRVVFHNGSRSWIRKGRDYACADRMRLPIFGKLP
jgi:hypothetical protein